jgi:hypothetical protein
MMPMGYSSARIDLPNVSGDESRQPRPPNLLRRSERDRSTVEAFSKGDFDRFDSGGRAGRLRLAC